MSWFFTRLFVSLTVVALDACGAYSSVASLKKILSLTASSSFATRQIKQACLLSLLHRFDNKNKKYIFLFCIVLAYSYFDCRRRYSRSKKLKNILVFYSLIRIFAQKSETKQDD